MDRIWRDALSIGDLGGAMAGWLEGHIGSRPGYRDPRPDGETDELLPVLARLNRRGWVTTDSQPGLNDRPCEQRAGVHGWISVSNPLLPRVIRAARATGLIVSAYGAGRAVGPRNGFLVTRWAGTPQTGFGGRPGPDWSRCMLPGIGRLARRELDRDGVLLAVIDPVWGRGDVLWPLLDQLATDLATTTE